MDRVVWWEVETADPELFQQLHAALSGWSFVPAFADTELGADYWEIKAGGRDIGGLQRAPLSAYPPSAGPRLYVAVDDLDVLIGDVDQSRHGRSVPAGCVRAVLVVMVEPPG